VVVVPASSIVSEEWLVAVDRGGTFTDVVAHGPLGELRTAKVLNAGEAGLDVVRSLVAETARVSLRVGTTVATNALLTRDLARVGLVTSRGLGDLIQIGHQARPEIFALDIAAHKPLSEWVVELDERVRVDGLVEREFDPGVVREQLTALRREGCESLVVCLAHAVRYPEHELVVGGLAKSVGFEDVVLSHDVLPREGLIDRTQAALVDAAVTPAVKRFVGRVSSSPIADHAVFMSSRGGHVGGEQFRGRNALLSGPAGGVSACARIAREYGFDAVLGFDMGGTSTDVCRWAGETETTDSFTLGDQRVPLPAVDLVSVAAGGGSQLWIGEGVTRVGPGSVGANPGPASYGLGTHAAVTDANLVLGRLQARWFPAVFGPTGREALDLDAAVRAVAHAAGVSPADGDAVRDAAAGFLAVANRVMADAIAAVSASRGHDPRIHVLVAMGGAGAQHACATAELLGISRVAVHPRAGVLSAWGIAGADLTAHEEAAVQELWTPSLAAEKRPLIETLEQRARTQLREQSPGVVPRVQAVWAMRYLGSTHVILAKDGEEFETKHERLFGLRRESGVIEVVTVRVTASWSPPVSLRSPPEIRRPARNRIGTVAVHHTTEGARTCHRAPVYDWRCLHGGDEVVGPALIVGGETTVVVDPGWAALVWEGGLVELTRAGAGPQPERQTPDQPDSVGLALYSRRFMGVAERMGATLARVAWSTNIKERLDFSCAVFTRDGRLLANAPHIPVHLGAMGETLRALLSRLPPDEVRPGRAWASNDPREGGSHLPDITVMSPVFAAGAEQACAWVASRGHHADVGGITPGSMPPFSTSLAEEGVVLRCLLLVDQGHWCEPAIRDALMAGDYPARDPDTVLADLKAQVAANHVGVHALAELHEERGSDIVDRWSRWIIEHGNTVLQAWLAEQPEAIGHFADGLDDGTQLVVRLTRRGEANQSRLIVDFAGTGPASLGNLNAPRAVVRAAVLYVLRCAIGRDIPLNEGVLSSVEVRVPPGCLLDPPDGSAVVAGNVETSQRVVDVLLGALGIAAASQGTMNNLAFGTPAGGYYETIAGGAGATAWSPGASCVQTHMTNTRITDVEVLEARFPVLVERFAPRRGSGGSGRNAGGEGVQRTLRFLAPVHCTLLSQRRTTPPFGLAGGAPGAPGEAFVTRDGRTEALPGCFARQMQPGDQLTILTPGGGGFGAPLGDAEDL